MRVQAFVDNSEPELRYHILASAVPALLFQADAAGSLSYVNERVVEYTGLPEHELLGRRWLKLIRPDEQQRAVDGWNRALSERQVFEDHWRLRRADGAYRWFFVRACPMFDDHGRVDSWGAAAVDIHDQRAAEERLRESEGLLKLALAMGQMGTWRRKIGEKAYQLSDEQLRLLGFPPGFSPSEADLRALYDPADWDMLVERRDAFDRTGVPGEDVVPIRRHDTGERRWMMARYQALTWSDGLPGEEIGVCFDITERKQAEARLQLMMDELNHRVKNSLATMVSLALQTAKTCNDIPDFIERFTGRIQALSKSNELLTRSSWSKVELRDVISTALRPFAAGAVISLGGEPEDLAVGARAAVSLSLVLHELCTNAVKYGALSTEDGRLDVHWRAVGEDEGELVWRETHARPVTAPTRAGFGSTLITRLSEGDLGGRVDMVFEPRGFSAKLRFKLNGAVA